MLLDRDDRRESELCYVMFDESTMFYNVLVVYNVCVYKSLILT